MIDRIYFVLNLSRAQKITAGFALCIKTIQLITQIAQISTSIRYNYNVFAHDLFFFSLFVACCITKIYIKKKIKK